MIVTDANLRQLSDRTIAFAEATAQTEPIIEPSHCYSSQPLASALCLFVHVPAHVYDLD